MNDLLVTDASVFLAVALEQPEKELIVRLSSGYFLCAPEVLHYEISNALIAMIRRKKLNFDQAQAVYQVTQTIAVILLKPYLEASLEIAYQHHIYAYDAFYLQCALQFQAPLLTLDKNMQKIARRLSIQILE